MKAAEALGRRLPHPRQSPGIGCAHAADEGCVGAPTFRGNEAAVTQVQEQVRALAQRLEEVVEESRDALKRRSRRPEGWRRCARARGDSARAATPTGPAGVPGTRAWGQGPGRREDRRSGSAAAGAHVPTAASRAGDAGARAGRRGGDGAAWPLVDEWRGLRPNHRAGGKGLAWTIVEERVLELEVALIEGHGLTLPPDREPVRGIWRESRLNWRKRALGDARRERAKAERRRHLRRGLTLGLWWE